MAPHRRTHPKRSKGFLSHVFSFVSREFESFVLNATAGPASQPVSNVRVKGSGGRRGQDRERNMSEDEASYESRTHHRRERKTRFKREPSRPKPRSKSTDPARIYRHSHLQPAHTNDDRVFSANEQERSQSPAPRPASMFPVSQPPVLRKQPSITMPGSLFPRSPSLMPDQQSTEHYTKVTSDILMLAQPPHPHDGDLGEAESGPSSMRPSTILSTNAADPKRPSLDQYVSPWRTRPVASVKDAIHRFGATDGAEADFSLMLPSPRSSPVKPVSKTQSVNEASPHRATSDTPPLSTSRRGKERARDGKNDDLDFIVCGSSGDDGVHAKERELDAAREEQRERERQSSGDQSRRASDERERDKRRIRALEEEVKWLKEELTRSQTRSSPPPSLVPPPPPPPPPPPLPLRIDTTPHTPTSMFATARASLRHAMTPIEAPINNPGLNRTRRQGQPTVNVPSEKMAAFLHEIKNAKLRRVGSGVDVVGGDGMAGPSGLSKSVSVVTSSASANSAKLSSKELLRRRSLASLRVPIDSSLAAPVPPSTLAMSRGPEVRVGQKRKADVLGMGDQTSVSSKRRMTQLFSQSSSEMGQHITASSSEALSLSSLSLLSHPLSINETDVTTPSLCSDNDRDENSIEDPVPSTPPGPRASTTTQKASNTDTHEDHIDVVDVDMENHPHPEARTVSPESVARRTSDLFKKRPPTSPIPFPTPHRPSAPARTKRGATPKPATLPPSDSDDELAAFPQATPVPFVSLIPVTKPKSIKSKAKTTLTGNDRPRAVLQQHNRRQSVSSGSGSGNQSGRKRAHRRRQTLDEELRTAEARSSDVDQCNDELDPEKQEADVFTATGTNSRRRGFLAHGGSGGVPVFMGVGYVQGAVPDSADEDGAAGMQPRRSSKSTVQTSLIPRPKVRT